MEKNKEFCFKLNDTEIESYKNWDKKLPKKYRKFYLEFIFTQTEIGMAVTVRRGNKEKNITNYGCW